MGLFLDEADAIWDHLPVPAKAGAQKSQRVELLQEMFKTMKSLYTVVQVNMLLHHAPGLMLACQLLCRAAPCLQDFAASSFTAM